MFYFLIRSENVNFFYLDSMQKLPTAQITIVNCCVLVLEE